MAGAGVTDRLARASWVAALIVPALATGGVHAPTVAISAGLVAVAGLCHRRGSSRLPRGLAIGAIVAIVSLLHWLPGGAALRSTLAPAIASRVAAAGVATWPGFTIAPAQTALELAVTLIALAVFALAARHPWPRTVASVAALGGLLAAIGLVHGVVGKSAIYGIYRPEHLDPSTQPALLTSFVNANHGASVLLLGLACAIAMAVDAARRRDAAASVVVLDRHAQWVTVYVGLAIVQAFALVLTLSRAAIVAAIVMVPPTIAIRRRTLRARTHRAARASAWPWFAIVALVLGLAVVGMRSGAGRELATLWRADAGLAKLVRIADDARLVAVSPAVGIGRGCFADLHDLLGPSAQARTHLESIPVAMLVELGLPIGVLVVLAIAGWWILAMRRDDDDRGPRRIALLGLAALAIQSTVDFGLGLAGVAVPVCALAGALAPPAGPRVRRLAPVLVLACASAAALAMWAAPDTFAHRYTTDGEIAAGLRDGSSSLHRRGLDARLHRVLARRSAQLGAWHEAHVRAIAASELDAAAIDGWLLRATAAMHDPTIDPGQARRAAAGAIGQALAGLRTPVSTELAAWLVAMHPRPEDLVARAPTDADAWRRLAGPMAALAPWHALALVRARLVGDPRSIDALRIGVDAALALDNAALALHYARVWRHVAPQQAGGYLGIVRALEGFAPVRRDQAIATLAEAAARVEDPGERGSIEEWWVARLLARDAPGDHALARSIVPSLLARPGTREAMRRRHALAARTREH